jgi:hypothetical protein
MTAAELVFECQTFQIARRSLVATCELFLENLNLLSTPYQVRSQVSETSFRVYLAAIEGATTEIGMGNVLDLESLTKEFQFVELGRQVAEFLSQHPHIDVIRLKSAIADLRRRLAGQDRELSQLTEASGRAMAEATRSSRACGERSTKSRKSSDTSARRSRGCRRRWGRCGVR